MGTANRLRLASAEAFIRRLAFSRVVSFVLLLSFFWMVAAASFSGTLGKWGLREGNRRYGIESILDGTADKPFLFRQLVPRLATLADDLTPIALKAHLTAHFQPEKTFKRLKLRARPELRFRYLVICYLTFAALLGSLFVLRRIASDCGAGKAPAVLAPVALVLALPYFQTGGGYFYDSTELLFLSLAFLVAARGKPVLLMALTIPATLNKETFLFFLPTLYPLFRSRMSEKRAAASTGMALLAAGLVNIALRIAFRDASGGAAELHLWRNLEHLVQAKSYWALEVTYGVFGPSGSFLGTLLLILFAMIRGWPATPPAIRQHVVVAAALNLPLFLVFGLVKELRSLSLLYVGFVVLAAFAMESSLRHSDPETPAIPRPGVC